MEVNVLLEKAKSKKVLSKEEIVKLLNIQNFSKEYYELLHLANHMTREEYGGKAYIFAQIGINAEPCSVNCKFCSMGEKHYSMEKQWKKTCEEICSEAERLAKEKVSDIFLMTTADYDKEQFIEIGRKVKGIMPKETKLVANIGDFDLKYAVQLKEAGFTGVYHICRLNEGIDTSVSPEIRIQTIENIVAANLDLYYCIEPIGKEHTYEQIADEMLRAKKYNVDVMAVMRRVAVPGTPMENSETIDIPEFMKIAAVTRIAVRPQLSMNAHETVPTSLICGINQLYAECGANPRDTVKETSQNRGLSTVDIEKLFREYGFTV